MLELGVFNNQATDLESIELPDHGLSVPGGNLEEVRAQQAHGRAREATEAEAAARLGGEAGSRARQFRD